MKGTSSEAAGWAWHTPDIVGPWVAPWVAHWVAHWPASQATPAANGVMVSVSPGCRREPPSAPLSTALRTHLPPSPDHTPHTFCAEFVMWGNAPSTLL